MKNPSCAIFLLLSSCMNLLAPSGSERTLERDVSGMREINFSQSFSSWGKLSFQQAAIFFVGEAIKRENVAVEQRWVEIYATQTRGDRPLRLIRYSPKMEHNEVFDLETGEQTNVFHGRLYHFGEAQRAVVHVGGIGLKGSEIDFKIVFQKPLPTGTQMNVMLFWADGP